MEYDELGRMISSSIASDEWGLVRGFTYTYDIPKIGDRKSRKSGDTISILSRKSGDTISIL